MIAKATARQLSFHLMDICWLVATAGEGIHSVGYLRIPQPMLNPTPSVRDGFTVVVWDVQTGVVVSDIVIEFRRPYGIEFCGNETIILISERNITLRAYDVLKGTQLSEVVVSPLHAHELLTHWVHRESFLFATSSETGGKIVIDIQTLQPTSNPPFLVVESFLVPHHDGVCSFSPVSFHASFLGDRSVFILDVRDSKILLQTDVEVQENELSSGQFSPDGRFFGCITSVGDIRVWKSTPAGYVPWSTPRPRFPLDLDNGGFLFSPTATSILSWNGDGIQLLDNHLRPPPPNKIRPPRPGGNNLVAYSADGTRIVTAQRYDSVVTVLSPLSDTPKQHINTDMEIMDIKIFDNDVFVVDEHSLVSWNLEGGARGVRRATLDELYVCLSTLSNDCARIAINSMNSVSLYDVMAQEFIHGYNGIDDSVEYLSDIQFSPDGRHLRLVIAPGDDEGKCYAAPDVTGTDDWCFAYHNFADMPQDGRSWDGHFPLGYHIRDGFEWVEDPRGKKLLWLPPDWRTKCMTDARWDGDFLALVETGRPEPPIIKFQP